MLAGFRYLQLRKAAIPHSSRQQTRSPLTTLNGTATNWVLSLLFSSIASHRDEKRSRHWTKKSMRTVAGDAKVRHG